MLSLEDKLRILGNAAKYDICASTATNKKHNIQGGMGNVFQHTICHSFTPDGRCVNLLKILMSNECQADCYYCPNRSQMDTPRASFTPEELSKLFIEFYQRNYVEGLFLSSGIKFNSSRTMDDMLKTCEIIRYKFKYNGYIHLKIIPNASYEYVEKACQLANRVSINAEVPSQKFMCKISNTKNLENDILKRMNWINELGKKDDTKNITQSTQFIVGAAGEKDRDILSTINSLYHEYKLTRSYFSSFVPLKNTPLENTAADHTCREGKLYQADFLMRIYKYKISEFVYDESDNLPSDIDIKLVIALKNINQYPKEINTCSYAELLKIPGIGPLTAQRLLKLRKNRIKINSLEQLKKMGAVISRSKYFITINTRLQGNINILKDSIDLARERKHYKQLTLF